MSQRPTLFERLKRWWPIAALCAFGAVLSWGSTVMQNASNIANNLDARYHQRLADGALEQLARVRGGPPKGPVRYMATFENRSDDPLLVVGIVYDVQQVAAATGRANNTATNVSTTYSDAGPVEATENYPLRKPCRQGSQEPLVPPFRIKPHAMGSFAVAVDNDVTPEGAWGCSLEVRFKTNQGETNGLVPDLN